MNDRALRNAESLRKQLLKKKDTLRDQLKAIDAQLFKVEGFIHNWHAYATGEIESAAKISEKYLDSETKTGTEEAQKRTIGNSSKEEVAKTAREIIRAWGRPVPRPALLALLTERGVKIAGRDRQKVLSTMLWRMRDEIVSFPRVGYWLAEEPWEPEDYDPRRKQRSGEKKLSEFL